MMKSLGHTVYHYGVGCDVVCDESIDVMDPVEMDWSGQAGWWPVYNQRVADSINLRKQHKDFVCVINGHLNTPLKNISDVLVCEHAIGYTGVFADYRVFASHSHQNKIWAAQGGVDPDGKFYDEVIPHFVDPIEYPLGKTKGDYYLYIGRLTSRKGVQIAVDTCKILGKKLKIAGSGDTIFRGGNLEYVGPVTGKQKIELYQNAIATFAPTLYLEPFGLTVLESQMVGTPVITTDFGAFVETVEHGKTGFRCHTMNEFVLAAEEVKKLDPQYIRDRAVRLYSLDTIKWKYDSYFRRLLDLWGEGWSTLDGRIDEHWLQSK
jgi:glycosyltransferase involved in cell wall biosynthesis